jgi:hypothetical protein
VPIIQHDLHEVIQLLNDKIKDLEKNTSVAAASPDKNAATLADMNRRLAAAIGAREMLYDSCCTSQSCNFVVDDGSSSAS